MLGRMFGHEFHALVIFQKFLIADDFAALFGFGPRHFKSKAANKGKRGTENGRHEGTEMTTQHDQGTAISYRQSLVGGGV